MTSATDHSSPTTAVRPRWRALLAPGWLSVIALALAFAGACWFVLAPWQFDRHAERVERNALVVAAIEAQPAPVLDHLNTLTQPPAEVAWLPVSASGEYQPEEQVYVRLRQYNGRPAYELVVPFRLDSGELLLVDRGYVSEDDLNRGYLVPDPPSGRQLITGRIQAEQPDPAGRGDTWEDGRHEVVGITADRLLGADQPVLRGFVQLTYTAPGVLQPIGTPQLDNGPFLSYAYQWITFGAVAALAIGFFAYREFTDPLLPEDQDPATSGGPGPDPRPARRRRGFDKSDLYD